MKNTIKIYFLIICGVLLTSLNTLAEYTINGKVIDANQVALSGVLVTEVGNGGKVMTDLSGSFRIQVAQLPVVLIFNIAEYEQVEKVITSEKQDLEIVLEKIEYQDIAFGSQNKKNVTSSVFSISGEELVASRCPNLIMALQGRMPGLRVIQIDGEPGKENFDFHVRGYDSPNSNATMFVVDGVERSYEGIDLHEIENVTMLRDAAATSMYGMRGSSGVILINTKKGFEGKSKISVSIDHSMQSPTRLPNTVSAYDYANMYNQRLANDTLYADRQSMASGGDGLDQSNTTFYTPYELDRYKLGDMTQFYPVRNMINDFIKDYSTLTRVNVNFRGGSPLMRYFTSVGYTTQGGLFENKGYDKYSYDTESKNNRFNFRTNIDLALNSTLNVALSIGGYMEKTNSPYVANGLGWSDLISKLYQTPNNAYDDLTPDGEVIVKRDKLTNSTSRSIYGDINRTGSILTTDTRLNNTFEAHQRLDKLTKGLSASAQVAFDIYSTHGQKRTRSYEAYEVAAFKDISGIDSLGYSKVPGTSNSTLSDDETEFFYYMYNYRASLDYHRAFAQKHDVSGCLMAQRHMQQQQIQLATNYIGVSGRLAYAFDNRYFAEGNFSYQGSEQFAKGNRFGFFPSFSVGWIVTNEKFLENNKIVNFLKLRASAGQTGNSNYGGNQYLFLDTWTSNAKEDQLGNPKIKWETSTKYNVGVETKLFNALVFGADLFYHKNTDIIIGNIAIIPSGMMGLGGASLPPLNIGDGTNKGFEMVLGFNKQLNKDLSVDINGNVSLCKNERGYTAELPYDETYAYPYRRQGYPINYIWGYRTAGLFNTQTEIDNWVDQSALGGVPIPGDIKYMDLTGDGVVDTKDQAPLGIGQAPEVSYGIKAQVNFKWFDFTVFLDGAARRNVNLNGFGWSSNNDNFTEYMKNAWTPDKFASGENIVYPRLGRESSNFVTSDYWVKDGSYLRLRNIELGFTLPEEVAAKISASSIRFYVNGLNMMTWDKLPNDDFDPESVNNTTTGYPILKALNFGVSVKF